MAEAVEEEDHPSLVEDPTTHHPPKNLVYVQPSRIMSSALEKEDLPIK